MAQLRGAGSESWGAAAAGLIALTAIGRLAASLPVDAPWIAPDEMLYGIAGRSFWESGRLELLGERAPFYGLYPLVAGLPLVLLGDETGILALKAVQAGAVALVPGIVYLWTRPVAGRWAIVAVAAAAALPALAYSGLLMSEALFLPAVASALWRIARTLEHPTLQNQMLCVGTIVLAVAIRLQGVALIATFVSATVVMAVFERRWTPVVRQWRTLLAFGAVGLLWMALSATVASVGTFGAYETVASTEYDARLVFGWVRRQLGDLFLLTVGAPSLAALILATMCAAGHEADRRVRALSAVAISYGLLVVLQVGLFASRYSDRLTERYLVTAALPLFVCFSVWLARGMPRPQPLTSLVGVAVAVPVTLFPVREVIGPEAVPDSFMAAALVHVLRATSPTTLEVIWALTVAAVVVGVVVVPRRSAPAVGGGVVAVLLAASLVAQRDIVRLAGGDREAFFGGVAPTWVDDHSGDSSLYFHDGGPFWNAVWHTVFWNHSIDRVAALRHRPVRHLPGAVAVRTTETGQIVAANGRRLSAATVVARRGIELFGTPIASTRSSPKFHGFTLWRTRSTPSVSTVTSGLPPHRHVDGHVTMTVFRCHAGALHVSLTARRPATILVAVDERIRAVERLAAGQRWTGVVPAPSSRSPGPCTYRLRTTDSVLIRELTFERGTRQAD